MPNLQDTRRRAASRARVLLPEDHPLFADLLHLLLDAASAQLSLNARRAA